MDDSLLNAEQIAKIIGVSRIQLYRKIKALTSQTVNQFIKSVRLKNAAGIAVGKRSHYFRNSLCNLVFQHQAISQPISKNTLECTPSEYIEKRNKGIR